MSSAVLPKDSLPALERWEPAIFAAQARATRGGQRLPTAADIERLERAAQDEGYAAGLAEGKAAAASLAALAGSLERELSAREAEIAEDLLTLALEVARAVVRDTLAARPEVIVPLVREALQELPAAGAGARFVLHPRDLEIVRSGIGGEIEQAGWQLVADGTLEPGGCRIESATTRVDATLATRWQRALAALGREGA